MPGQTSEQCQNLKISWAGRWLPVIVWATVISVFSTHVFTSDNTSRFIIPVLHWFFPHASSQSLERMHFFIRKSGHFTEYFILSLLILRGIRAGRKKVRLAWMAIALLGVALYASLDEFHQRFVPGRTAAVSDVILDTTGGAFAQLAAGLLLLVGAARERRQHGTA
ncbi:MAG TPA: VanZ family protein [Candidatus Acidoferrales bacterium]